MESEISLRRKLRGLSRVMIFSPGLFVSILFFSLVAAVLEGIGLSFILPIVEYAQEGSNPSEQGVIFTAFRTVYEFVGVTMTLETIIVGAGFIISLRYLSTFLSTWLQAKLQTHYVRHLQTESFEHALGARVEYFDAQGSDEILNAIVTQSRYAGRVVGQSVIIINQFTMSLMYIAIALLLAPWLTLITAVVLGGFLYFIRTVLESGYSVGDRVATANEEVQETVQAGTQGIRDVKLFGMMGELYSDFQSTVQTFTRSTIKLKRNKAAIDNAYRWAAALTVFVLIYAAFVYSSLSLGGLGVFLMAMFRLAPKLSTLNNRIYELEGDLPHLIRMQDFIQKLEENQEPPGTNRTVSGEITEVMFDDVSFAYEDDPVLKDVSFSVEKGEFTAFVGPSGAGKSTIVSLLARMYEPDSGEILANKRPIQQFEVNEWREHLAVVRQNPFIFNDTLRYNITVGVRDVPEADIRRVCDIAEVNEFLDELPHGLDTELGDDGVRLSGGQRQRIAIARALIKDTNVLVLDEATSDLDSTLEGRVHTGIENMDQNQILIVIAHRLSTVINANRIYTMKDGRIVESGPHEELLRQNGKYAELYAAKP